jgi:cell division protein FtsZ
VITGGPTLSLREVQDAANIIQELADPEANIIFGTCRDNKADDEVKITMVAAAFPVVQEPPQMREVDLQKLLQDVIPEKEEELDVPSFLRRQANPRSRGLFR